MLLVWLASLTSLVCVAANHDAFQTLLHGEQLKGYLKVSPVSHDEYLIHFDIKEGPPAGARWSVHTSSAPYDSAVMTENCRRVKKSPHIIRNQPIEDKRMKASDLIGHTIVVGTDDEVFACATVILPGQPLLHASFHADPILGHIHIIPLKNQVRLLPDLRFQPRYEATDPQKEIIDWAFVASCDGSNVLQNSATTGIELGIDSRTTITLDTTGTNISLVNFELFRNGRPFACAPIVPVEQRALKAHTVHLTQQHSYEPVRCVAGPSELHIRDDCLDLATETIHEKFEQFYPSMSIFGADTQMLKSLAVTNGPCVTLRPQFARPASTAHFSHPIVGRLILVDTDDTVHLTGHLRSLFDETPTRATVQISPKWADAAGCPQYLEQCTNCFTVPDAAVITGKNDTNDVTLSGVLPFFEIKDMRSVIVDLEWTKVCANLTHLPTGAISARAYVRRYSPVSAPQMASVVVLEYPANNYTEVVLNKKGEMSDVSVHARPVDMAVTGGPPCGELTIGAMKNVTWLAPVKNIVTKKDNDSSVLINDLLVTGKENVLGSTLLASHGNEIYCGHFVMDGSKTIAVAKFNGSAVNGFVKLTQFGTANAAFGMPTEVYYALTRPDNNTSRPEEADWEIVNHENATCATALIYNPFKMNATECSRDSRPFCPVGAATQKSSALTIGTRKHRTVEDLPLAGSFSVIRRTIRLRTADGSVECALLREFNSASFRWTVHSNYSLGELQAQLAKKLNIEPFQINIEYNRELTGGKCSIYRVTIIETDERLAEILDKFNMEEKRFKTDPLPKCGSGAGTTSGELKLPSIGSGTPTERPVSGARSLLSLLLSLLTIALLRH